VAKLFHNHEKRAGQMKNIKLAAGVLALAGAFTAVTARAEEVRLYGCSKSGHLAELKVDVGGSVQDGAVTIPLSAILQDAFAITANTLDDSELLSTKGLVLFTNNVDKAIGDKKTSADFDFNPPRNKPQFIKSCSIYTI
jgi:hypothetical protein